MKSKVKTCAICKRPAGEYLTLYPVKERVLYGWHRYLVCDDCVRDMRYDPPDNPTHTLIQHISYTAVRVPDVLIAKTVNDVESENATHVNQYSADYAGL